MKILSFNIEKFTQQNNVCLYIKYIEMCKTLRVYKLHDLLYEMIHFILFHVQKLKYIVSNIIHIFEIFCFIQ